MSLFIHFLFAKVILPYPPKGVSFKWSKQKFVCGKIMVKRKITAKLAVIFLKNGGPNRDRTDDLTDANRTLSQLSYGPISKSIMLMQTTQQIYEIYCKNERHGLMGDGC